MADRARRPRLLIFVIAYYAESTLRRVLERIPASVFGEFEAEVLVVDDASEDRTFAIGQEYRSAHPEIRMTVLRNEYNQGYGGNQKVGYAFADSGHFDFVAMVHGDGQYAPEQLPLLLEPLVRGEADAVFGSRMLVPRDALKGGMPLYKFVGNRVLTTLQNAMLGTALSEFHSGYRIYSVRTLRHLPYRLNSNDFHFDTEIIIQLHNAGARIVERPIPTYYGDEICRVDGMKYAKNVLWATLQNVAHRSGVLYQRRFDPDVPVGDPAGDELKLDYASSHSYAIAAVPPGARVLEIGSPSDRLSRELAKKRCVTTLVTERELGVDVTAGRPGVRVVQQNLEDVPIPDVGGAEYILLLDVVEHLRDPERFVEHLRSQFDHRPKTLILTTPNIAFVVSRLMLLIGQFNYSKTGILDRTHTRLFTFRTLRHLLRDTGFRIKTVKGVPAPFPKAFGDGAAGKMALAINLALIRLSKSWFAYQIYVEAETTPDIQFVVRDTKLQSALRAAALSSLPPLGSSPPGSQSGDARERMI